ncbi:MAG: DUF1476 domain-containing protein [Alphaproteobacteria bacterium]|nr:DUF1476 domain-containing protein [Alphaproteobacteria bacterium]MDA7983394.1 DUF1476 domain-containing protein [Alphaproteobacteria bacterium]MDA7985059.1 DUF1476 domain-containing protein [Alphaproteobacteria bacterium]MDA7987077.1 DUF1476 domain-containing protein [Alphaproteobacteria bacterium]MDA7988409.1 DUF1476 domain-containing protein [Alphaproteobacteria bacterium]
MTFKDREKAFEKKFEHDETMRFKAESRRNAKLAQWACEIMGRRDVEAYRAELQVADFEEAGDEDVFRKLRADCDAHKVEISDHRIRRHIDEAMREAIDEVKGE